MRSVCLLWGQVGQPFAQGVERCLGAVGKMQFAEDIADMRAHSPLADDQLLGY